MKRRHIIALASLLLPVIAAQSSIPPGTWWVFAQPSNYSETNLSYNYGDGGYVHKGKIVVTPGIGKPTAVTFSFINECWQYKEYDRTRFTAIQNVPVSIDQNGLLVTKNGMATTSTSREYPPNQYGFRVVVFLTTSVTISGSGTRRVTCEANFIKTVQQQQLDTTTNTWKPIRTIKEMVSATATAEAQIDISWS